jgi:hypothetical protein
LRCKRCKGDGRHMRSGGYTKADMIDCKYCRATGEVADDYYANSPKKKYNYPPYPEYIRTKKTSGMEQLEGVVGV